MTASDPSDNAHIAACRAVRAAVYEYLDGEMTADACRIVVGHLDVCAECSHYVEHQRHFLAAIERCACADPAPDELKARVRAALNEWEAVRRRNS